MELATLFPSSVRLEPHEVRRINRARLALMLHRFPAEIDAQPPRDVEDMIALQVLEDNLAAQRTRQAGS